MNPRVIEGLAAWSGLRPTLAASASVGFVPTMGALHEGHLSLLRRARAENDTVVASIFVNPTQFNNPEDLEKYPRVLDQDVALIGDWADYVFAPAAAEMYDDGFRFRVTEGDLSRRLEGAHRPGHFDGVLSVVLKLFQLVPATRAYFGEKDWQQLQLVRGMAAAFFLPVAIVPCPTVRDANGLALSSRNARLSPAGRQAAARLYHHLRTAPAAAAAAEALRAEGFGVDYVEDVAGRRLAAVHLEGVRLIDNVAL